MAVEKRCISVPSSDGIHTLSAVVYAPTCAKKGLFQVVHGMTEHIDRYDRFMQALAEEGYVVFGHNHVGHKGSVRSDAELGYFAKKDGWRLLVRDVRAVLDAVNAAYGENGLPYILMGHSMGSFVVRLAAADCVHPDKLIVMGTGGANPAAGAGLALASVIRALRGEKHISPLLESLAFGTYNKRFGGGTDADPKPWLTNDAAVRERYYNDPYCMFHFSVSAMRDLICLIKESNGRGWYESLSEKIEVLLVSGASDPVGGYGKGIREVEEKLLKSGHNVRAVLYEGARHEILNDFTYGAVRDEILRFLKI